MIKVIGIKKCFKYNINHRCMQTDIHTYRFVVCLLLRCFVLDLKVGKAFCLYKNAHFAQWNYAKKKKTEQIKSTVETLFPAYCLFVLDMKEIIGKSPKRRTNF